MSEYENVDFSNQFASWQGSAAFNTYWQYSYVNRSAFYSNIKGEYREYMIRWVQNSLWWYDGWVPYFHNNSQGIFSTRIGTALVNGAARKVVGGKIYFKNKNLENKVKDENGKYIVNDALAYISSEWADKVNFGLEIKKAITFAAAAGTSLLKLDKQNGVLIPKALRFDSFYPTVGYGGKLIELYCYIKDFTKLADVGKRTTRFSNFYVVEHRYFGDYIQADGKELRHIPLVEYEILKSFGTITTSQTYDITGEKMRVIDLPRNVREELCKAFSGIEFNKAIPLPFADSLGAELVNWSECVSSIPELPFGDSLLSNIIPYLQSYDYYWSAFNTDMYIGRGRVLISKYMQSAAAKQQNSSDYNSGLDSMLFTKIPNNSNSEEQVPTPIQFDLRSQSWMDIRTMIIQNIAINTGMNLATIASFLNDNTAARTAREISTEESETALFVEDKRAIVEKSINKILKLVLLYNGYSDDVVIRWSQSGLTNIYTRTDMLATAVQNNLVSKQTAAQMFMQDDDEYQQAEEWDRIQSEQESGYTYGDFYGEDNLNDRRKTFEFASAGNRGSGNADSGSGEARILPTDGQDND